MTTTLAPPEPAISRPGRPLRTRLSAGHLAMIVAALLAGLANYAVLRSGQPTAEVVVATRDLAPGTILTAADVTSVSVTIDGPITASLARDPAALVGRWLVSEVSRGAPLRATDTRASADPDGLRRISLPVDRAQAAGGAIVPGDRVDVLLADDGVATYLVAGAEVVEVAQAGGSPLDGLGGFHLTITVDVVTAQCLAAGMTTGTLTVTLATGAVAAAVDGCRPDGTLVPLVPEIDPLTGRPTGPAAARSAESTGGGS